jgi:acyl-coenzyme A synthetase/AMP-(fatty) acid ligase
MVWAATTFKYTFDYHPTDVYFCTADIGWVTGLAVRRGVAAHVSRP